MRAAKRDRNEKPIIDYWKSCGCIWIPMQPGQGFDGLLIDSTGLYIVEIKNAEYKWQLTTDEAQLKAEVESMGQKYYVIQSLDEAAKLIGMDMIWDASVKVQG